MDSTTQELERRYESMRRARSHDVFGLWEGCGRALVNETYYKLVKEYHPDNYASDSPRARELAQEIFLLVRAARTKLLKLEKEKVAPAPDPDRQDAMERLKRRSSAPSVDTGGLDALSQASEAYASMSNREELAASSSSVEPPKATEVSRPTSTNLNATTSSPRSSLSEPSMSSEERRQALEALSSKRSRRPLRRSTRPNMGDENSLSAEERRAKLAELAGKRPKAPFELSQASAVSLASESDSAPLAASSSPSQLPTGGHRPEAVTSTDTVTKLTPREAFRSGYQDFKLERYAAALDALKYAHEKEPENGLFMTYYAYALFKLDAAENKTEAENILRAAIKSGDRQAMPDAHLFLGLVLTTRANKEREALQHFRAALQLNPTSHQAQRQIRLYEMRQRQRTDAPEEDDGGSLFRKLFKK